MGEEPGPSGGAIMAALSAARVEFVAALPDIWTSAGLLWPVAQNPAFRLIRLCKEDEGVSICAALAVCRRRAVLMMQHTGLLDSLNAVRAVAIEYRQPVCMIVGLLEKEPDVPPSHSRRYGVRIVEPILDAMGVDHLCLERPEDVALLHPAIERAFAESRPVAALIGRRVEP